MIGLLIDEALLALIHTHASDDESRSIGDKLEQQKKPENVADVSTASHYDANISCTSLC